MSQLPKKTYTAYFKFNKAKKAVAMAKIPAGSKITFDLTPSVLKDKDLVWKDEEGNEFKMYIREDKTTRAERKKKANEIN